LRNDLSKLQRRRSVVSSFHIECTAGRSASDQIGDIVQVDHGRPTQDIAAFDNIAQFADISAPPLNRRDARRRRGEALGPQPGGTRQAFEEMLNQQWNVFTSFPQRRRLNRNDVETIKEIAAELAVGDKLFEIAVGGSGSPARQRSRWHRSRAVRSRRFQNAQQLCLNCGGEVGNSSRKIVPPSAALNLPSRFRSAPVNAPLRIRIAPIPPVPVAARRS